MHEVQGEWSLPTAQLGRMRCSQCASSFDDGTCQGTEQIMFTRTIAVMFKTFFARMLIVAQNITFLPKASHKFMLPQLG